MQGKLFDELLPKRDQKSETLQVLRNLFAKPHRFSLADLKDVLDDERASAALDFQRLKLATLLVDDTPRPTKNGRLAGDNREKLKDEIVKVLQKHPDGLTKERLCAQLPPWAEELGKGRRISTCLQELRADNKVKHKAGTDKRGTIWTAKKPKA